MATIQRLLGIANDTGGAGGLGTPYDTLAAGLVPDTTTFWPVTGGTVEKGLARIDRNTEVRGRRAASAPRPFRAEPVISIPGPAYPSILKKLMLKTLGGVDVVTGVAPAALTHTFGELGFGSAYLPGLFVQMVRDNLNQKASGCSMESLSLSFPLDGEATFEATLWPLYVANFATAAPSVSFTGLSVDPLVLRDAQVMIDGSMTGIPDLQSFTFTFANNQIRKHYPRQNRETRSLGTGPQSRTLWWPAENKLGAAQDVTYHLDFGNTNVAQELAMDFTQIQKFVFEAYGNPLGTTPPANELMRITIYGGAHTGGGPGALSARDEIVSGYDGGVFYSDVDAADIKVEFVDNITPVYT